jgi:hypothetical protein
MCDRIWAAPLEGRLLRCLNGSGAAIGYSWRTVLTVPSTLTMPAMPALPEPSMLMSPTPGLTVPVTPTSVMEPPLIEVRRLLDLGARRVGVGQGDVGWVLRADPERNEFCVLADRRP